MPRDTPAAFQIECRSCGAQVELVDGLINDCGRMVAEGKEAGGVVRLVDLEGAVPGGGQKRPMGYELAEQFGWELPDVILYPTGGGTGLIGMWKAFDEMEAMGWISAARPRMVSVQAAGCAPIVRAFEAGQERAELWEGAHSVASGLRVPVAVGDFLMLRALRQSRGTAVAVTDEELIAESHRLARYSGLFSGSGRGGRRWRPLLKLKERGWVGADERVVLFNTGTGYKYLEALGGA